MRKVRPWEGNFSFVIRTAALNFAGSRIQKQLHESLVSYGTSSKRLISWHNRSHNSAKKSTKLLGKLVRREKEVSSFGCILGRA